MLVQVVLCAALATSALGDSAANRVMDDILSEMASETEATRVDPAPISSFKLKVKGDGSSNQDFEADFDEGSLIGLGELRREGDCSLGPYGSVQKMVCNVSLAPIRFRMSADVKGDQTSGVTHSISTSTSVAPSSLILIELQGERNFEANVIRLTIRPVTMTTSVVRGKVELEGARLTEFIRLVSDNLAQRLAAKLNKEYKITLNMVANRYRTP